MQNLAACAWEGPLLVSLLAVMYMKYQNILLCMSNSSIPLLRLLLHASALSPNSFSSAAMLSLLLAFAMLPVPDLRTGNISLGEPSSINLLVCCVDFEFPIVGQETTAACRNGKATCFAYGQTGSGKTYTMQVRLASSTQVCFEAESQNGP